MKNKLFQLLARNRGTGTFRAEQSGNEATIWLYDVIVASDSDAEWFGGVSAQTFVKQIREIDAATIHLRINSPGGDVFAARAMEQAIREHKAEIVAHVDGYAASAASLVAVAGDRTIMAAGSFMMIHRAWTIAFGNAAELMDTAALLEKVDDTLRQSYETKAGTDAGDFAELMAAETWFTAEEAVEIGLADEVSASGPKASAQPRWDLSAYTSAPEAKPEPEPEPKPEPETDRVNHIDHRARSLRLVAKAA